MIFFFGFRCYINTLNLLKVEKMPKIEETVAPKNNTMIIKELNTTDANSLVCEYIRVFNIITNKNSKKVIEITGMKAKFQAKR